MARMLARSSSVAGLSEKPMTAMRTVPWPTKLTTLVPRGSDSSFASHWAKVRQVQAGVTPALRKPVYSSSMARCSSLTGAAL